MNSTRGRDDHRRSFFTVRKVIEYLVAFTAPVLCSHSDLAASLIMYSDLRLTGNDSIDFRPCFSFSYGRNLNVQSDNSEIPAIISKGGASRCQLITEPTGYSVINNSENASTLVVHFFCYPFDQPHEHCWNVFSP